MQIYQLPPAQRAEFYELLTAMDEEWMKWADAESKRKHGNSKAAD
jgi:succinate dehydrogenase flavin-adding protein (antitoxin of CptAB toxin-antitoxin module)